MTYVKRRGMILLVDDTQVSKYTGEGFEVYTPPKPGATTAAPKAGAKDGSTGK